MTMVRMSRARIFRVAGKLLGRAIVNPWQRVHSRDCNWWMKIKFTRKAVSSVEELLAYQLARVIGDMK